MLLDGANSLFQTLDSLLNLAVRKLDERAGFPELLVQIRSIIGMTPVEMHLKPFCHHLEFMLNSIGQNGGAPFDRDDFSPKGLSSCTDNLLLSPAVPDSQSLPLKAPRSLGHWNGKGNCPRRIDGSLKIS